MLKITGSGVRSLEAHFYTASRTRNTYLASLMEECTSEYNQGKSPSQVLPPAKGRSITPNFSGHPMNRQRYTMEVVGAGAIHVFGHKLCCLHPPYSTRFETVSTYFPWLKTAATVSHNQTKNIYMYIYTAYVFPPPNLRAVIHCCSMSRIQYPLPPFL